MASMNSAAAGTRPYAITAAGPVQLSASEWPSPVVGGQSTTQDALFSTNGGTKFAASLGDALNSTGGGAKYLALSASGSAGGWTLTAADTTRAMSENMYAWTGGTHTWLWAHLGIMTKLSCSGSPPTPSAYIYSTDGGANWTTPANTGLTSGWSSVGAQNIRPYSNGAFRSLCQLGSWGNPVVLTSKISIDSGGSWTDYTPGSEGAYAYEYDSGADLLVAITSPTMFGTTTTVTVRTSPRTSPSWTSRQTFTVAAAGDVSVCILRIVGSYCYLLLRLSSGGWTLLRALVSNLATANPFSSVHVPGSSYDSNRMSLPVLFSDGKLRYMAQGQIYKSSDGSSGSWSADGASFLNSAGQLTPI